MKFFGFGVNEINDKEYIDQVCDELKIEYGYTSQFITKDNVALANGYDGIFFTIGKIDKEVLDGLKENGIKYVACRAIGFDNVDVKYANSIGIKVSKGAYSTDSVANFAIMLILMSLRRMKTIMKATELQYYHVDGKIGKEISKCTVGVIGTGKIGLTALKHLAGFGCKILAYDIFQNEETKKYAEYVDLDTIYAQSDVITIHVPGTPETVHMIDDAAFAKMKDGIVIVNTARGDLIDSAALIRAVKSGKVGAAGLDVIEGEEKHNMRDFTGVVIPDDNLMILRSFPNVIVTNHIASFTTQTLYDRAYYPINSLITFNKGEDNFLEVH